MNLLKINIINLLFIVNANFFGQGDTSEENVPQDSEVKTILNQRQKALVDKCNDLLFELTPTGYLDNEAKSMLTKTPLDLVALTLNTGFKAFTSEIFLEERLCCFGIEEVVLSFDSAAARDFLVTATNYAKTND